MNSPTGQIIKTRLDELEQTLEWLGGRAGVSINAVSKWIKTGQIARDKILPIADALEITADELLRGELGPREPRNEAPRLTAVESRLLSLYRAADDRGKLTMQEWWEEFARGFRAATPPAPPDPESNRRRQVEDNKTHPLADADPKAPKKKSDPS